MADQTTSSQGRRRRPGIVAPLVVLVLFVTLIPGASSAAATAETTITFEDLAAGSVVTSQYENLGGSGQGVVLGSGPGGTSAGAPAFVLAATAGAKSGSKVVSIAGGGAEFNPYGIWGRFPAGGKKLVRVFVGAPTNGPSASISLVGVDLGGNEIPGVKSTATVPADGKVDTKLEIQDAAGRIAFFKIVWGTQKSPGVIGGIPPQHRIDDLSFDVPASVPGPTPPAPPAPKPDFGLTLDLSTTAGFPLSTSRGHTSTSGARVLVNRVGGSNGPLTVATTGLPAGVTPAITVDNKVNPVVFTVKLVAGSTAPAVVNGSFTFSAAPATPAVGPATRSVQIPFTVVEDYDLAVTGIDVTQGIQPAAALPARTAPGSSAAYAGVPLVRGKKAVVRVFGVVASPAGSTVKNVGVLLHGRTKAGKPLPGTPLKGTWASLSSGGDVAVAPQTLVTGAGAVKFTLPPEWTKAGSIDLEAELLPPQVLFAGPAECGSSACATNNRYRLRGVPFFNTGFINIHALRLKVAGQSFPGFPGEMLSGFNQLVPVADGEVRDGFDWRAVYDVTTIANAKTNRQVFPLACLPGGSVLGIWCDAQPNLDKILISYAVDYKSGEKGCDNVWQPARHSYCADATVAFFDDRGISGPGGVAGLSKGGRTISGIGARAVVNYRRPLTSVAHELGHGFGLKHASGGCGGGSKGQKAVSWPDAWGSIRGIGYDVRTGTTIATGTAAPRSIPPPATAPGREWYDFMSYCADFQAELNASTWFPWKAADSWISTVNWQLMHTALRGLGRSSTLELDAAPAPTLAVWGFLDRGQLVLARVGPGNGTPSPPGTGPYRLVLRDAVGRSLGETRMVVETSEGHGEETTFVSAEIPLPGAAAGGLPKALAVVEVTTDAGPQARLQRSAHRPTVRILGPSAGARIGKSRSTLVRWRASDADKNPLTATVDYSLDDGRTWRLVWKGKNAGRASIPSTLLSGSRQARLRVRVSDGFDESAGVSPRFIALGVPPTVRIVSPSRGTVIAADARLALIATATDDRFRRLPARNVRWYLGKRQVARGSGLTVGNLKPGRYVFRAVARDRDGRSGFASVRVRVRAATPVLVLRSQPARVPPGARVLRLQVLSTVPSTVSASGPSLRGRFRTVIGAKAKRIAIPIRTGPGSVRLVLRARAYGRVSRLALVLPRS